MGLEPDVIGSAGNGAERIGVGLWEMKAAAWPKILKRVGVSREISQSWFNAPVSPGYQQAEQVSEFA